MEVKCFDSTFDVPDIMVEKFFKDFDGLPGSANRGSVLELREHVYDMIDAVAEEPDLLEDPQNRVDFIRVLAIQKAMENHGIFYDA
jgi:hypothetical protein